MLVDDLKVLCELDGISGFENSVREFIINEISPYVNKIIVDNLGNIIVVKQGANRRAKKLMLCAHQDEVGLIVTSITKDGYIKFSPVGGVDERILIGKEVKIGTNQITGIIGVCPVHLLTKEEREKTIKIDDLYIDIGASSEGEAKNAVKLGEYISFKSDFTLLGDNIKSKAIDDRIGCLLLIDILKSSIKYDIICVFTVREELGCIGASVAANTVKPDVSIILEATTANDIPSVCEEKKVTILNNGVVIPFMDKGTIYDKELYNLAIKTAEDNNILWQTKTLVAGSNDSRAIQKSSSGVRVLSLSIPCRYLHTASCVASIKDIASMINLLKILIDKI